MVQGSIVCTTDEEICSNRTKRETKKFHVQLEKRMMAGSDDVPFAYKPGSELDYEAYSMRVFWGIYIRVYSFTIGKISSF